MGDSQQDTESFQDAKKCVNIAAKIAPIISGLTESEFRDVFQLLEDSLKEIKDPIKVDFVPHVSKINERFNRG